MAIEEGDYSTAQRTPPAMGGEVVTPSDTVDLSRLSRSLYVGAAGNIVCIMADGETLTFPAVPAGSVLPISVSRVLAAGTTASSMVAIW